MADKSASHWPITFTYGAAALFNLFLPLGLVRLLSTDQMGQYKIFFLYVTLAPALFFVSGLNNGLYHWVGKYPETKPEVRQSWTLLLGITLILCAAGLVFSERLAAFIHISNRDLQLLLLSVLFMIVSSFLEDLLIARGNIWTGSLYASGFNVLKAAGILAAAWWTRSVEWVIGVFVAGSFIRVLAGWLLLVKSGEIRFTLSFEKVMRVLRYAMPVSIAGVSAIVLLNVDQMILSFRLNPEQFAFYSIGCLSVPPLEILATSVNRVLIPRLSRAFAANQFSEAASQFAESVSELFRFLLPATVGLMLYSQPIIRILFTERYLPAVSYLRFYALIYVSYALPYDSVARARADGSWILQTALIFAPLSIGVTWFATGRWGAMGALIAVLSCQFLMRFYSLIYDRQSFAESLSKFIPFKDILIQSGLVLVATACSLLLRPFFTDLRMWFLVTAPIFTIIYFTGLYAVYIWGLRASGTIRMFEPAQILCFIKGGLRH